MQALGKPLLVTMVDKYNSIIPVELRQGFNSPIVRDLLARTSLVLGLGFLVHACAVLYAALRMSNWWWLIIRGVGVYVMMFVCVMVARMI